MSARATPLSDPFVDRDHDHELCVNGAMDAAVALCAQRGARLTPLRKRVLELVWHWHRPVGAYEILDRLREDGRASAPPTVYRALAFLSDHGLVHRVDSLNAYIGCPSPDAFHRAHFLICQDCGQAAEIDDEALRRALGRAAKQAGFEVRGETVEITGLCGRCRD